MNFNQAKKFIYKNARPLDFFRWKYLFEGGGKEDVLNVLAAYQNEDGGFGHALEADCWNEHSSPVQTWAATEIIEEIGLEDKENPVVLGILRYLSSGKHFNGSTWANTVPSNNDFPHAPWWEYVPEAEPSYNPTACLIAFVLKYAHRESSLFKSACKLAQEAYGYFKAHFPIESAHTVYCFVKLYERLTENPTDMLADLSEFKALLQRQIKHVVTYDTALWETEYVCKPSLFIRSKASGFYAENREICERECDFIENTQLLDGAWAIPWSWTEYAQQWHVSKNWWKSNKIIEYLSYLKAIRGYI